MRAENLVSLAGNVVDAKLGRKGPARTRGNQVSIDYDVSSNRLREVTRCRASGLDRIAIDRPERHPFGSPIHGVVPDLASQLGRPIGVFGLEIAKNPRAEILAVL